MDRKPKHRRKPRRRGLTFLEILVVMVILALIAGIIGTQLLGEAEKAKADATRIQIRSLESALGLYRLHNSKYPSTEQGLNALISQPQVGNIPDSWQGPYLTSRSVPEDGWGNPYRYTESGNNFTIVSLGADGAEGGSDLDTDISNTDL